MGENTCEIRVGRLLEIRLGGGLAHAEDVQHHYARLEKIFSSLPEGEQVVIAADWRGCPLMSPEAAAEMKRVLTDFNQRIERSAAIGSNDSPTTVLQFFRVIREGGHPDRKFFSQIPPLLEFLSERLDAEEMKRLRAFLDELGLAARQRGG